MADGVHRRGASDGYADDATACSEYYYAISTVPEPLTLALLAPSVVLVLVVARRRTVPQDRAVTNETSGTVRG